MSSEDAPKCRECGVQLVYDDGDDLLDGHGEIDEPFYFCPRCFKRYHVDAVEGRHPNWPPPIVDSSDEIPVLTIPPCVVPPPPPAFAGWTLTARPAQQVYRLRRGVIQASVEPHSSGEGWGFTLWIIASDGLAAMEGYSTPTLALDEAIAAAELALDDYERRRDGRTVIR